MHALDTLDAATSLTVILRRSQLARLLDHRIQRESPQNAEATPAIRQHKYSQERLDMLTGVVTEPDRQSQQGRYKGINRSNGRLLPTSQEAGEGPMGTHRCGILERSIRS
jgi:hypothetical protein